MTRSLYPSGFNLKQTPDAPPRSRLRRASDLFGATALAGSMALAIASDAQALPSGGTVAAGGATFASAPGTLAIHQSTQNVSINWQSFSINAGQTVTFVQPNSASVALNRVTGGDPTVILGALQANGQVFLVNPGGVLFGKGAQVNVGGLVASTLNISDADFMAGRYKFVGSPGSVSNAGSINAGRGYVALLGGHVANTGAISATLGTVILAAGEAVTLDVAGDGLLNVTVDKGLARALIENRGVIMANGGRVVMTAQAAGQLLKTVVNNTGVIEAQTLQSHDGEIRLLGDLQSGTVNQSGALDASAPNGGNGGFIETSAASVKIAGSALITTAAPTGVTGTFSIDPHDFTIGAGGDITGATLSAMLVTNSVVISTTGAAAGLTGTTPGNGDINVNAAVAWTAS
jgi:filamentous hemagglutinin family protein